MRMRVESSSRAICQSLDMPIESSGRVMLNWDWRWLRRSLSLWKALWMRFVSWVRGAMVIRP